MLRRIALVVGVVLLPLGVVLPALGVLPWFAGGQMIFTGLVLLGALFFERWQYQPKVHRGRGEWQDTGERFVDPASGKLMEVRYNPATGERDYAEVSPPR